MKLGILKERAVNLGKYLLNHKTEAAETTLAIGAMQALPLIGVDSPEFRYYLAGLGLNSFIRFYSDNRRLAMSNALVVSCGFAIYDLYRSASIQPDLMLGLGGITYNAVMSSHGIGKALYRNLIKS